jgi:hypothetical protein
VKPPRPSKYTDQRGRKQSIRWRKTITASGFCRDGCITINSARSLAWQAATLYHELMHRAAETPYVDDFDGGLDELIVNSLSTTLANLWHRNADVFAWIHYHLTGKEAPENKGTK